MSVLGEQLAGDTILLAPGVYDGLTALIAEQAGAKALYLSGASIAYSRLGRPDIGLVSMNEVADVLAGIRDRVGVPLIVDADTGFGNALNVQRTVRVFERCGANALQLEDQTMPKKCGHLDGKILVGQPEMVGKIRAAVDARRDSDTLIVARTDALAVEGLEAALDRAEAYQEAGADVLFVEAPRHLDDMRAIVGRLAGKAPLLANMVEGGKTPLLTTQQLQDLGYKMAIFPGGAARALAASAQVYYRGLVETGSSAQMANSMLDFNGLNTVIGTAEQVTLGKSYEDG